MPEIVNDTLTFDAEDLTWLIEQAGHAEWSVFIYGVGVVLRQDPNLDDHNPASALHTEQSARETAAWINANLRPRTEFDPNMNAVALHYGVPVATTPTTTNGD